MDTEEVMHHLRWWSVSDGIDGDERLVFPAVIEEAMSHITVEEITKSRAESDD